MATLKLWIEPPLQQLTGTCCIPDRPSVLIETITCEFSGAQRTFTLMSTCVSGSAIDADLTSAWRGLNDVFELMAFAGTSIGSVVASRVEPDGIVAGRAVECLWYPGLPSCLATLHFPFGLPSSLRFVTGYPDVDAKVRTGISWYLRSIRATDPFERLVLLWTTLEALAPPVRRESCCTKCGGTLSCPDCGPVPPGPAVLQSILALCEQLPGVSAKEVRDLYKVRSAVVHGSVRPDFAASSKSGAGLLRLWEIAHLAIKGGLGWSHLMPPVINFRHGFAGHSMQMRGELAYPTLEHWKHPVLAEWELVRLQVPSGCMPGVLPSLPPTAPGTQTAE